MALFIGIDLPEETKKIIYKKLEPVRNEHRDFSWLTPDDYNIPLLFFPEKQDVSDFEAKMYSALQSTNAFELYSREANLYIKNKLHYYLEFHREHKLEDLVENLQSTFEVSPHEKFVPRISLGKSRIPSKQIYFLLKKQMQLLDIQINFPTDTVYLYESVYGGKKPVYLKKIAFQLS
ncbi:hypothetical protein HGA88_04470 [Candidatus Roizmanbacteria bacterium]|nr:hypothetical protein [Candidatus Roizmanbacteria bacterium]